MMINLTQISNISYKTTNFKAGKHFKNTTQLLPIVSVPLVSYMLTPNLREKNRLKKIAEETEHIAKPVTDRTVYNTEQLKKAGVKDSDIKKFLKSDGRLTDEGKTKLKENHLNFKGTPEDKISETTDKQGEFDNVQDSENIPNHADLQAELDELDNYINNYPAELQEVLDTPVEHSSEELIEMLGGDLPKGLEMDWNFKSLFKNIWDSVKDLGEDFLS